MKYLILSRMRLPLALLLSLTFHVNLRAESKDGTLEAKVRPFLTQYCVRCHGPEKPKANIRLDQVEEPQQSDQATAIWKDVMDQLILHKMPPDGAKQPGDPERDQAINQVQEAVRLALRARQSTGGRVVVRRLNQREYENTVADLLHLPNFVAQQAARGFPPDGEAFGFDNIGASLNVTAVQLLKYGEAADYLLDHALVTGPRPRALAYEMVPDLELLKNREHDLKAAKEYIASGQTDRLSRAKGEVRRLEPLIPKHKAAIEQNGPKPWYIRPRADNLPRIVGANRLSSQFIGREGYDDKVLQDENGKKINGYNDFHIGSALSFRGNVRIPGGGYYKITAKLARRGESRYPQTFCMSFDKGDKNDWRKVVSWQVDTPLEDIAKSHYEATVYLEGSSYGVWCTEDITLQREIFRSGELTGQVFLHSFRIDGPIIQDWPPKSYSTIFVKGAEGDRAYAREILERFARRAYRRPVLEGELDRLLAIFDRQQKDGNSFAKSVRAALRYVLISPPFLYLIEYPPNPAGKEAYEIDDHGLAARLSYFLWGTMPDSVLFDLAQQGQLRKPDVFRREVERMLDDSRSQDFIRAFVRQWLGLKQLELRNPDVEKYPHFDDHLRQSMFRETEAFFGELLTKNLSIECFLISDFAMLNERLAVHYGIKGVKGDGIRRVPLDPALHRGGVLGQGSILMATSTDVRTSPVARGAFVLEKLLGYPRPIPPANVPDLAEVPDEENGKPLTLAKKMELHRNNAACMNCHRLIDPLGLALENFDAVGAWRKDSGNPLIGGGWREGNPIDATGTLPKSKTAFLDPSDFRRDLLKAEGDRVGRGVTEHLLVYALGRGLELTDAEAVDSIAADLRRRGNGLRDLVHIITQHPLFRRK